MAAADNDLDSGLFDIALSDSEGDAGAATETVRDRTGQTEGEFQAVKRAYRPKVDNGEVSFFLPSFSVSRAQDHPHPRAYVAIAVDQKEVQSNQKN